MTEDKQYEAIVERVARKLCAAYGDDYDEQPESGSGLHPHNPGLPCRKDWRDMARAAYAEVLAALEEPTQTMMEALMGEIIIDGDAEISGFWAAYRAALRAAPRGKP